MHRRLHQSRERTEVLPFVAAAGDEHDRLRETLERHPHGVGVRGLGIVDEPHALPLPDRLQPVLKAAVLAQHAAQRIGVELERQHGRERGQHVGEVVGTRQTDLGARQQALATAASRQHDPAVLEVSTVLDRMRHRERGRLAVPSPVRGDDVVIGIGDRPVLTGLPAEQPLLRRRVFRERAMTVEVVGSQVEPGRDRGPQLVDRLQLEARDLDHEQPGLADVLGDLADGAADVAADRDLTPRRAQQRTREVGRRALAVGAGDTDERSAGRAVAQLEFAEHPRPGRACGGRERVVGGDARTPDHEVVAVQEPGVIAAPHERDARSGQLHNALGRGVGATPVAHRHGESVTAQQARRREPTAGRTRDQCARAGERMPGIERHCSLSVDSDSRASSAPAM